jgi:uncharacterized membrane protein
MKPSKELKEMWRKDPDNWKWGEFYFNKEDKCIFPPKRNKYLGWTINFATPKSYTAFILLVLIIIGLSKLN